MNERPKLFELLVFGGTAFVLSQAIISMILILEPGDPPNEGNLFWRLILIGCYLGVAFILVPYHRETFLVIRRNGFLAALVLLALASCAWSSMPALVLQRSIGVLGTTLLGIGMAVRLSLEDQLRFLRGLFRIIAILSLVSVVFFPSYGISDYVLNNGEWRGIFSSKNTLGSVMALSILVELQLPTLTRFSNVVKWLVIFVSATLLFFSRSNTSMFSLLGALLLIEIYKFAAQRLRIPLYAIVLGIFVVLASGVMVVRMDFQGVTGAVGRTADLSGRTEIWNYVLSYVSERPVLGYGYSGFWAGVSPESDAIDRAMGIMIMYSHNGLLEILLTLGAVGLFFALGFLGTGLKRAYDYALRNRSGTNLWPLAFLIFILLYNLTECTVLLQNLEWALCVATVVGTGTALLTPEEELEEELLLVPSEEMI